MPDGPVERCGSCGCQYLIPVLNLGMQPLPQAVPGRKDSERYPLRLVECARCTLVQLDYIAPQAELFPADYPYATGNTKALRDHFRLQACDIAAMISPGDLVIDIGGNDGTMLRELAKAAPEARLLLIEPTDQALKCVDTGIGVEQAYFTAELARQVRYHGFGTAAVIVTSNTFGHVPDPHDFLRGVTELLDGDGTFLIDNQDWHNITAGLQIDTIYHEHLRYYTPLSLAYLLNSRGLDLICWNRIRMHGGGFRAAARHQAADLGRRAWDLKNQIRALVLEAATEGPVYAVGAPTRATSLVNYTGIGKYLACACEIAGSAKIGAFIPGTIVPVVDEQRLLDDQPPHALLLAWDLAPTLVPLLRERGYKGKFLTPLPVPKVLDG